MNHHHQFIITAINAAHKGGEEILKVYKTDFSVEKKEDKSPLTLADKNSHNIISEILSSTGVPVLSEEGKDIDYAERKNWKRLWIVDPLDGTKEFVKRNGEFTVNIALVERHEPVIGIIYVPVTGVLYFAAKSIGAFRSKGAIEKYRSLESVIAGSEKLPVNYINKNFSVVASRSHITPETEAFINKMKKIHGEVDIISAGSSLKFCLVAEGRAEVYPRFGPTMEWDTAAGQAIVQCAGKNVIDINSGKPIVYNRENLRNGSFVVE